MNYAFEHSNEFIVVVSDVCEHFESCVFMLARPGKVFFTVFILNYICENFGVYMITLY